MKGERIFSDLYSYFCCFRCLSGSPCLQALRVLDGWVVYGLVLAFKVGYVLRGPTVPQAPPGSFGYKPAVGKGPQKKKKTEALQAEAQTMSSKAPPHTQRPQNRTPPSRSSQSIGPCTEP